MALKDLLTDLSKFKYTNYENVGANNSPIGGRHGGYEGGGEPPHPEEHSKFDDKVGKFRKPQYAGVTSGNEIPFPGNYDPNVGGIHGGIEPLGQPPHSEAHSLYDDGVGGIGNPQSFTVRGYTVSDVISGRHGGTVGPTPALPPHPDTHSDLDDSVGFGVYPNDNPQSFNVRGYTITGTKTFDRPNQDAITIMTNRLGFPYTPFDSGVKTGPVDFLSGVYGSWGPETFPLGFSFNMVDSLLSPGTPPVLSLDTLRHTIPEVGPSPEFTFSNIPKLADAHSIDSLSRLTGYPGIYIGSQGEINETLGTPTISSNGITFTGVDGPVDHTVFRSRLYEVYQHHFQPTVINFVNTPLGTNLFGENEAWKGGSIHIGAQDIPPTIGGGVTYYGSLVSITPRSSIYRAGDGTYRVPQSGHTTIPPGVTTQYPSNIPTFDGTQITHNIPKISPVGETWTLNNQPAGNSWELPIVPNAHGSNFMVTPLGGTNFLLPSHIHYTLTHNVDMITLSGPTTQTYQTTLNTTPIATGAHGSDFETTPIEAYSSIFATQDGLIMDTIYDSGFNRGDMYIKDHLHQPHPEFKEFSRTDTSLKRIKLDSPNFDSDGNKKFTFKDRAPYNIPARDNNVIGFDQPFILKDIGDRWGPGGLGAIDEGLFRGGFVTSAARTVADVLRIGKFILTPKGIMFGLKQAGLQLLNPRKETTIWNPLSLIGSLAPMVHMDRHFGTATEGFGYESVINFGLATFGFRPGSILYAYGTAVNLPGGNIPALEGVTARRVTGAHIVGMVPSAGGVPGTFPSIPEIDIDLSGGNITSLTVGTNKYGPKTLLGNKEYPVTKGATPLISGIKLDGPTWGVSLLKKVTGNDIGDQGEYTGRSYGELDKPILYDVNPLKTIDRALGGYSITRGSQDSPITTIPYDGNYYEPEIDFIYQKDHNKGKLIPITGQQHSNGPGYGLAAMATAEDNYEQYDGTKNKLVWFRGYDDNDKIIIEPPLALTSVLKTGIFQGQFTLPGEASATKPGSYSSLFGVLHDPYKSLFGVTEQSIGEVVFVGKPGLIGGKPAVMPFLSYNVKPSGTQTISIYNPLIPEGERGVLQGFNQGSGLVYDTLNKDYPAELQIRKEGIFLGDLYKKGSEYFPKHGTNVPADKPLYLGYVDADLGGVDVHTTRIYGKNDILPGTAKVRTTQFDHESDGKESKVFTISSHPGKNFYKKGTLYLSGHGTGTIIPIGKLAAEQKGFSIGQRIGDPDFSKKKTEYNTTTIKKPISISADTFLNFSGDIYSKDLTYSSQIDSRETPSSPPTKTRLRTHATTGDPTVTIKTSHKESDPNTARFSIKGKYKELEDIKLQDFPLINLQSSGNLGRERQSLGFVNKEITGLQGNLFGIPDKTRHGFGVLGNKKYTEIITKDGIVEGTLQGKDTDGLPKVEKTLAYEHKFAPDGIKDVLKPNVNPDFKTIRIPKNLGPTFSTKTTGFTNQTGNILDRYKTLAYGEIPTTEEPDKRYSKKILARQAADKKAFEHYDAEKGDTTGGSTAVVVIDPELGLIKKTAVEGGSYTTDLVDKVNMHQYQDNDVGQTDSIKFKFYDIVNSKYIIFKAYLSGVSETLSPEWSSEKYIGRPDSVHVYQGVERSMSFEFMVVPNTKQELPILWEKMNYLVGLTYPSWRSVGTTGKRMEAPFINLTIGDMYNAVPGFLSSLSITVDDNSPWELDEGFQLPHAVNVSCEFTHIGQHALASQGKHFDLHFLRNYNQGTGELGTRNKGTEGFILDKLMGDDGMSVVRQENWTLTGG